MSRSKKNKGNKRTVSKGTRLKWGSLRDEKPIALTPELTKGKLLSPKDLQKRSNSSSGKSEVLVP